MESQLEAQLEAGQEALEQTTDLLSRMWQKVVDYVPTLTIALIVLLIGMLIAGFLNRVIAFAMKKSKLTATASGFGRSLISILLYSVLLFIFLAILGVPTASIIAVIGAAGLAIGLALQNSLSNVAGGFIILFAKPFQRGDYVSINGEAGYIEEVTILYTELITLDKRSIFLPNSIVSSSAVQNLTKNGLLRVNVPVTVSYDTNLGHARDVLMKTVKSLSVTLKNPEPAVAVTELGSNGVTLTVLFWVKSADYFVAPSKLLENVKENFGEAGIEIPYPQLDVHAVPEKGADQFEDYGSDD